MRSKHMEINVKIPSTEDAILYINQLCNITFQHYNVKDYHKECFLIHELAINAVEATKKKYAEESKSRSIIFQLQILDSLIVRIIDEVGGLSQEYLDALDHTILQGSLLWAESGRGLLLIKEAAEEMWYRKVDGKYELGFKKGVSFNE